ncbi:MAG: hypothetical protein DSY79_06815, partial [Chloroflexi bacterium]
KDGRDGYEKILLTVSKLLQNSPKAVRFFGGMRFDAKAPTSPEWQDWGTAHFTLPMIELSIVDENTILACHIFTGKNFNAKLKQLQQKLESLQVEDFTIPDSPLIRLERHDLPEYHQWCRLVEQGLDGISSGKINKVVLARSAVFSLARDYDPTELLLQLRRQGPQAAHRAHGRGQRHARRPWPFRAGPRIHPEQLSGPAQRRVGQGRRPCPRHVYRLLVPSVWVRRGLCR